MLQQTSSRRVMGCIGCVRTSPSAGLCCWRWMICRVDEPSLAWIAYLGRRAFELAVLVVVSVRDGDPAAARPAVGAAVSDREIRRFRLGPLSLASVLILVRAMLGPATSLGFCVAVHELLAETLFVHELLAAADVEGVPPTDDGVAMLRSVARWRLARRCWSVWRGSGLRVALARALSVLGPGSEVLVVARLAGLEPMVAELIADALAAAWWPRRADRWSSFIR